MDKVNIEENFGRIAYEAGQKYMVEIAVHWMLAECVSSFQAIAKESADSVEIARLTRDRVDEFRLKLLASPTTPTKSEPVIVIRLPTQG